MIQSVTWTIPLVLYFCAHGAGYVVPWYQVEEYMHLDTGISEEFDDDLSAEEDWQSTESGEENAAYGGVGSQSEIRPAVPARLQENPAYQPPKSAYRGSYEDDKEHFRQFSSEPSVL